MQSDGRIDAGLIVDHLGVRKVGHRGHALAGAHDGG
jgi:hypothetical protein